MPPDNNRTRPLDEETGPESALVGTDSVPREFTKADAQRAFADYDPMPLIDRRLRQMVHDAFRDAAARQWRRRALEFDRVGTPECDEVADACRNKALFIERYGLDWDFDAELDEVLSEWENAA